MTFVNVDVGCENKNTRLYEHIVLMLDRGISEADLAPQTSIQSAHHAGKLNELASVA